MNINSLTEQSISIITEYYNNNLQPFFDCLDENILWIGPAEGQWIQGSDQLRQAWSNEEHNLRFTMSNITSTAITSGKSYCEIVLTYRVFTYYPDGKSLCHDQRLHYTWCERRIPGEDGVIQRVSRILLLHISNAFPYDTRDTIYPVHYTPVSTQEIQYSFDENRILTKGIDRSTYYLLVNTILWMESTDNGFHTIIHTKDSALPVVESLSAISKKYPGFFIRIHSGYLVNPQYVYSLKRFQIELTDQTRLPVPQKKYTLIKKVLEEWLAHHNRALTP